MMYHAPLLEMPRMVFEVPFVHEHTKESRIVIVELSTPEVDEAIIASERFGSIDNPLSRRRAFDRASTDLPLEFQRGADSFGIRLITVQ